MKRSKLLNIPRVWVRSLSLSAASLMKEYLTLLSAITLSCPYLQQQQEEEEEEEEGEM